MKLKLIVNHKPVEREVPEDLPLVEFLNEELGLTGTKFCCGIGVCRACTVSVRRSESSPPVPVLSCSTPVRAVDGRSVTTVEGLAGADGQPNLLQQIFLDDFAFQCGYCTPGFLMATTVLMERLASAPIREARLGAAIEQAVGPHVCRCTGYVRYHQAIRRAVLATPGLVTADGEELARD